MIMGSTTRLSFSSMYFWFSARSLVRCSRSWLTLIFIYYNVVYETYIVFNPPIVGVGVGVVVAVAVGVEVRVFVGVAVGVGVEVLVGVEVGVAVKVDVGVTVGVLVGVVVGVAVGVGRELSNGGVL